MTTKRLDRKIKTISDSDAILSAPKIRKLLTNSNITVPSTQTIRWRLHEYNKHGRVSRKVPYVSKINIKKRMDFYTENVLKPMEFRDRILWTDETMIRLKYSHGRIYVWRITEEVLSNKCTIPTLKSQEKGIMVCAR